MRLRLAGFVVVSIAAQTGLGCGGCGDDDGGAADGGGFVLVSRTPEPDDGNVWVRAPIVLTFSRALDAGSVTDDSIALSVAGEPVAHETSISDDGTTVSLVVSEPPATPALVDIAVTTAVMDEAGDSFAGESWSFTLPPWQHPAAAGAIGDGARPALVVDGSGAPVVAFIAGGAAVVKRLEGGTWSDLGGLGAAADVHLAASGDSLVAASFGDTGVAVAGWSGSAWEPFGTLSVGAIDARPVFDVAVDGDGNAVVAVFSASAVQVARWNGQELASEPPLEAVANASDLALAVDGTRAVVALISGARLLRTFRQLDAGWEELSGGVDFSAGERPEVVAQDGVIAVSWQKDDSAALATRHAYAARWDPDSGWLRFAHAADLDIQTDAMATSLALDGERATMAWFEGDRQSRKVYAARASTGDLDWTFLDSALNGDPAADAAEPSLAIDGNGDPIAAFVEDGQVMVARWNASPTLRRGLADRLPAGDCAIPETGAPPATLAATGCYADVAGHQLAPQLIPFEINSPLWSDGALKRRFMLVPDGESIGYTESGALTIPIGTLLVKEFWLERVADDPTSRFPIETRFLVKRCEEGDCLEPWQGYSYRWRADGSEADLIDPGSADERTDWTVTASNGTEVVHTHIYPARLNCTRCHNAAAGRVLGLQAIQIDRPARYGAVIDNQIDTLAAIGVLTGVPSGLPARLPSSLDPGWDAAPRSRAYFHANCAQCHRPGGERPTIDFRFQAPLAIDNICNKLTPGDGTGSLLYTRDSTRGDGQMPPLATDVADGYQLAITAAWIDGLASCP